MTLDQDIDEQIKLNEQILEEVPKKIAELQGGIQQLKDVVTGASYAVIVLKSIKIRNAVKPPAPQEPPALAAPPPQPPGEPCPAPEPTTPPPS